MLMLTNFINRLQTQILTLFAGFNMSTSFTTWLSVFAIFCGILLAGMVSFYLARYFLLQSTKNLSIQINNLWLQSIYQYRVFHRFLFLIPAFIIYCSLDLINLTGSPLLPSIINGVKSLTAIYMVVIGAFVISSLFNSFEARFQSLKVARFYSIKSYFQVAKIILYFLAGIFIISILMNKSPMYFLTGLGAMTAVILLIFRDSILGFVASIQLNVHDVIRINDWIEMPNFGANGIVTDISLNTIKVQNFDNTIVTIPSYAILSNGVKNWRGMSESGGRRIKRAFYIDVNSIKFCNHALLNRLSQIPSLKKLNELTEILVNSNNHVIAKLNQSNDCCLTNLGIFRIYLEAYLREHPKVHSKMTFIVRELEATGKGIPVEIYLFSNETDWMSYEKIQADIFDYIYAI